MLANRIVIMHTILVFLACGGSVSLQARSVPRTGSPEARITALERRLARLESIVEQLSARNNKRGAGELDGAVRVTPTSFSGSGPTSGPASGE